MIPATETASSRGVDRKSLRERDCKFSLIPRDSEDQVRPQLREELRVDCVVAPDLSLHGGLGRPRTEGTDADHGIAKSQEEESLGYRRAEAYYPSRSLGEIDLLSENFTERLDQRTRPKG